MLPNQSQPGPGYDHRGRENSSAGSEERGDGVTRPESTIASGVVTALGIPIHCLSFPIAGMFLPGGEASIAFVGKSLRMGTFSFGLKGVLIVANRAFQGAGRTVVVTTFSLCPV